MLGSLLNNYADDAMYHLNFQLLLLTWKGSYSISADIFRYKLNSVSTLQTIQAVQYRFSIVFEKQIMANGQCMSKGVPLHEVLEQPII